MLMFDVVVITTTILVYVLCANELIDHTSWTGIVLRVTAQKLGM